MSNIPEGFPFSEVIGCPKAMSIAAHFTANWLVNFTDSAQATCSFSYYPNARDAFQWAVSLLEKSGWDVTVSEPDADGFLTVTLSPG